MRAGPDSRGEKDQQGSAVYDLMGWMIQLGRVKSTHVKCGHQGGEPNKGGRQKALYELLDKRIIRAVNCNAHDFILLGARLAEFLLCAELTAPIPTAPECNVVKTKKDSWRSFPLFFAGTSFSFHSKRPPNIL